MPKLFPDLMRALALLAAALVCAGLGNRLARADRKLDWTGWAPPAGLLPATPAPPPPPQAQAHPAAPEPAPLRGKGPRPPVAPAPRPPLPPPSSPRHLTR